MGTSDIEAAINSTTQRKEDLRKAFEFLQSHSSPIISFSLQWKDIEDHFSSIEKLITERFKELKELDGSSVVEKPAAAPLDLKVEKTQKKPKEVRPRPELKDLCVKMDGEGLIAYITDNKNDIVAICNELGPAILSAPDPVALVLDSIDGFAPSVITIGGKVHSIRRTCASLLERINGWDLEINQQSRDRAMEMALKWKEMIKDGKGDNSTVVMSFLNLVTAFGLVESFGADYIFDIIAMASKKKHIIDLLRSSAFEGKMPDLVDKLNNSGKQLDAVRYVLAFNLANKYPPASLFKAYLKQSKRIAHEVRVKGNNSVQSQNEAIRKEIDALKETIKTVEEYKLGSSYPVENLQKRIEQLEKQKSEIKQEKKRGPAPTNASNSNNGKDPTQLHQKPPSKRPRPSDSSVSTLSAHPMAHNPSHPMAHNPSHPLAHNPAHPLVHTPAHPLAHTPAHPLAHNPAHPLVHTPAHPLAHNPAHPLAHNPAQIGVVGRTPYEDFTSSYSLGVGSSLYSHGNSSFPGEYVGLGGSNTPLKSYMYPSESIVGSGYSDRAEVNGSYKIGVPAYNPSAYNPSYNPSLYR